VAVVSNSSVDSSIPIIGSHAYTVAATFVNAGTQYITVRNPWGYDGAGSDGNPSDGLVTITLAQFQSALSPEASRSDSHRSPTALKSSWAVFQESELSETSGAKPWTLPNDSRTRRRNTVGPGGTERRGVNGANSRIGNELQFLLPRYSTERDHQLL